MDLGGELIDLGKHKREVAAEEGYQALSLYIAVLAKKLGGRVVVTKADVEDVMENPHVYTMTPHPTVVDASVIICEPIEKEEEPDAGEPAGSVQ